jgi:hypothetical protein
MATTTSKFIPELWSQQMLDTYKLRSEFHWPKRSKGAQLLRDAALGHPEYPEGEFNVHKKYATDAAKYLSAAIDADILNCVRGR